MDIHAIVACIKQGMTISRRGLRVYLDVNRKMFTVCDSNMVDLVWDEDPYKVAAFFLHLLDPIATVWGDVAPELAL